MSIGSSLRGVWFRLRRRKRISRVEHVGSMSQVPKTLGATAFVVEKAGIPRWIVLACPCRCGARIDVNLMKNASPHWTLIVEGKRITIKPSLWQPQQRCGSHFFITRNTVKWV
jgi:hypothetical protein